MYKIGFFGCQHLGYAMKGMNRRHSTGQNLREVDGFIAHTHIMKDALEHNINGIVDGGDLFHVEHPSVRAVNTALHVDDLRVAANDNTIWRITNGGNHDNGAGSKLSAVSHVHRTWLNSQAVYPDPTKPEAEQVGPWPGFYEVHQPDPTLPLYIHVVSHNGLDPQLAERGITIDPQPLDGGVNILVSHGIFSADGRLFGADDSHGATRVIPEDWANRGWDQIMLSDYHTLGPIPGFGPEDGRQRGQVWMTGSAVRRGFSDEACGRGWLELTLQDNGETTITPHYVWQRPQVDFPIIDARTMTSEEIDVKIRERLRNQDMWDQESETITGDGGFLLRQVISHTTPQQRRDLASCRATWAKTAEDAAFWSADYVKPLTETVAEKSHDDVEEKAPNLSLAERFLQHTNHGKVGAVLKQLNEHDQEAHKQVIDRVHKTLTTVTVDTP